jgi:hypothetical protein
MKKKASGIGVGRTSTSIGADASWFGRINLHLPDENWPFYYGEPMIPLCQLNLTEVPYLPALLSDVALITIFISSFEFLPVDEPNGKGWELRAYSSYEGLVEIKDAPIYETIKPFPIVWDFIEADYPSQYSLPSSLQFGDLDFDDERFPNHYQSKLGGWPSLIQGPIFWAPKNRHPSNPEYVFQINSEREVGWMWGDLGIGYFGRWSRDGTDDWALSWQCY